jgi:putative ABC transport system permease protein
MAKKYVATGISQYTGLSLDLSAGQLLKNGDHYKIILPDNYLSPLGFANAQDAVGTKLTIGYLNLQRKTVERELTVVGVMKKSFISQGDIYIDDAFVSEVAKAQGEDSRYPAIMVKFTDGNANSESKEKSTITSAGPYDAESLKDQIKTITTIISAITTGLNVVGVIALFAASFGIINTLLMSVYERTQEVGLMKALGMHRLKVFILFAVEAVLVGFWGSLLAVGAGYGVSRVVDQWASSSFLKDFEGFNLLIVTPLNALIVIGLIMLIAFLAGTLPAIKASRLNPIEALRSE